MLLPENKIYSDGGHYIAIPHTTRPKQKRKNKTSVVAPDPNKLLSKKDIFDELYKESMSKPKRESKGSLINSMREHFDNDKDTKEFVEKQLERKRRNEIVRRTRLFRKVHLQTWNWFCTFTYDDEKHTEESFRKTLSNCLSHLSNRKEWKYIGVWERSTQKQRLHFHGIFYIPENAMVGELKEVTDYDTVAHRKQTTRQNTYFNEWYGRSDFKEINNFVVNQAVMYLIKYIEKSGEKLVYSRGLPTYFIADIDEEAVLCPYGQEGRKLLLFDNFNCWDNGEYMGVVSPNLIKFLRKSN